VDLLNWRDSAMKDEVNKCEKSCDIIKHQAITKKEALNTFYEARKQMADIPEMSLEEINEEISKTRASKK
jgi:hypothetical protein